MNSGAAESERPKEAYTLKLGPNPSWGLSQGPGPCSGAEEKVVGTGKAVLALGKPLPTHALPSTI